MSHPKMNVTMFIIQVPSKWVQIELSGKVYSFIFPHRGPKYKSIQTPGEMDKGHFLLL